MHLNLGGDLQNALLTEGMPNKRAHAALVNVYLKTAMDEYLANNRPSRNLTVSPAIGGLLKEASGLDNDAYVIWVATVAAELVLDPKKYASDGYVIPWDGISLPFLLRVWEKGDPTIESTT